MAGLYGRTLGTLAHPPCGSDHWPISLEAGGQGMSEAFPRWTFEHSSFANAAEHWVYVLELDKTPSVSGLYSCIECAVSDVKNDRDKLSLNPFVQQGALVACIHA
eukprot:4414495-Amphidinium_carterae.1